MSELSEPCDAASLDFVLAWDTGRSFLALASPLLRVKVRLRGLDFLGVSTFGTTAEVSWLLSSTVSPVFDPWPLLGLCVSLALENWRARQSTLEAELGGEVSFLIKSALILLSSDLIFARTF